MELNLILENTLKLGLSILFGFILGIERKNRSIVLGTRTLVLISVSCTLVSIFSNYLFPEDHVAPARVCAGVLNGIGFLGGGAILRTGLNIKGLTSAAVIFTAAVLGLCLGAGLYLESTSVLVIVVFLLVALEKVEEKLFPAGISKKLHIAYKESAVDIESVKNLVASAGYKISDINISRLIDTNQLFLNLSVRAPFQSDYDLLIEKLKDLGNLVEFSITD